MLITPQGNDDLSLLVTIQELEKRYVETNNPIYAMQAFRLCFVQQISPPTWAMQFMAVSIHDYLENYGTKSLELCFQLQTSGKGGKTKPMTQFLLDQRDQAIMLEMYKLVELVGISQRDAAHMVKSKLAESDWNKTLVELDEPTEETIFELYRKKWRKSLIAEIQATDPNYQEHFNCNVREKFLASFPEHSKPLVMK